MITRPYAVVGPPDGDRERQRFRHHTDRVAEIEGKVNEAITEARGL